MTEALGSEVDIRMNKAAAKISMKNSIETTTDDFTEAANEHEKSLKPCRVECEDGSSFIADFIVCTVPLGCLKDGQVKFEPELPASKQAAINRLEFGPLNKVVLSLHSHIPIEINSFHNN